MNAPLTKISTKRLLQLYTAGGTLDLHRLLDATVFTGETSEAEHLLQLARELKVKQAAFDAELNRLLAAPKNA